MTFTEKLRESLNGKMKYSRYGDGHLISMYLHLLDILILQDNTALDWIYEFQNEEGNSKEDVWFFSFHKGFRQWDVFNTSIKIEVEKMTKEEVSRYKELSEKMKDRPKDWVTQQVWKDLYEERQELSTKYFDEGYRSIGGHLDMLFWNTIQLDKHGVLMNTMSELFEDISVGFEKIDC